MAGRATQDRAAGRPPRDVELNELQEGYLKAKAKVRRDGVPAGNLSGPARIGRVAFSKTGRTLYYGDRSFQSLNGQGFKANYLDVDSGEELDGDPRCA